MSARSDRLHAKLTKAGFNVSEVRCFGSDVHIVTFRKYEERLSWMMGLVGLDLTYSYDAQRKDTFSGCRLVYTLRPDKPAVANADKVAA